jgi:FkbM family methyltransferase
MKARFKSIINLLRYRHIKKDIKCNTKWIGNRYGGFFIVPDLMTNDSIVYSFGIGKDVSFDTQLIRLYNCKILAFDPTPNSIEWCKKQKLHPNFSFYEFGLARQTMDSKFFLPKKTNHVSGSLVVHDKLSVHNQVNVKMKSFSDIVKEFNHKTIDIVKLDIEGSEYDVVDSILASKIIIKQIVLEVHERFFNNGKEKTESLLKKLRKKGYLLHSISYSYQELSFLNKKFIKP